jgi:asparagine synthase (glutamine-hydrolysing)
MCGIAGLFTVERPVGASMIQAVLAMLDAQKHRGPNDWGILVPAASLADPEVRALLGGYDRSHVRTYEGPAQAPSVVIGTRRLSIIDLSSRGRMPMSSADGRLWVTYNGEIYNYRELRAELSGRGYEFRSDADTEVIVHGYAAWGRDVVQHLRGMFAFALVDVTPGGAPTLLLGRDRFGIKPLFWARAGGLFQFASEVRGLMAGGFMPEAPEPRAFHGFLVHGSVPTPWTTVRDVFSLPAAHTMSVDDVQYSFPTPVRYWTLPRPVTREVGFREAVAETRSLLEESVREHLVSDVPLGVFLSGGMDSAAITALAARHLPHPVTTLTVSFDEAEYSEGEDASAFAARHGAKHLDVRVRLRDFIDEIPRILAAMDQPSVDGVNTYFIAKAASEAGLTVVLSGLGGDEVFWGYDGFRRAPHLARMAALPGARLTASVLGRMEGFAGNPRLEKAEFLASTDQLGAYLAIRGVFTPRRAARLLGAGELPLPVADAGKGPLTPTRYGELEMQLYLQNQLLRDADVFGMAHSLEVRVPFLDHRLVEHVAGLPESVKLGAEDNKPLLAAAAKGLIDETVRRPKRGFTFPFQAWMHEGRTALSGIPPQGAAVVPEEAAKVWTAFDRGRIHWSRPWALAVLSGMRTTGSLPRWPARTRPSRVLFVLSDIYSTKGGIQVYNQALLRAVGEAFPGAAMRVISANDSSLPADSREAGRIQFVGCGPHRAFLRKVRVAVAAAGAALAFRPDAIVCGHINYAPLVWALRLLGAPRFALIAHGIEVWSPPSLARWFARRAGSVYAVSRYTARRMHEWGVAPERIRVLPNNVDGEVFRRFARPKPPGHVLLTVARLSGSERSKGVDQVIAILPRLRSRFPSLSYRIGGTGDDVPRLKALTERLGLTDTVEFLGYVPDESLPEYMSRVDVLVMPSRKEGFGIVFIEALACGVPVIGCGLEGSRDALMDGRLGLLIDPTSERELEDAIAAVLAGTTAPDLRDGPRLRAAVLEEFGVDSYRELVRDAMAHTA